MARASPETRTLDLQRLLRPAIDYAENGFPVTYQNSAVIAEHAGRLHPFPDSAAVFLDRSGRAPTPGTRLRWPQLAASMREIAEQGRGAFYTGELAHRIARPSEEMGGILTLEDLAEYEVEWQECLEVDYRDFQVFAPPLPSAGFQSLQHLKLMECFDPSKLAFNSADTVHALVESAKLSITDRIACAGDPDHVDLPLEGLSPEYAAAQRDRLDMNCAATVPGETSTGAGSPMPWDRPRPSRTAASSSVSACRVVGRSCSETCRY